MCSETAVMCLGKDSLSHLHISSTSSPAAVSLSSSPVNHLLFILSLTCIKLILDSAPNDSSKSICNLMFKFFLFILQNYLDLARTENNFYCLPVSTNCGTAASLCCVLWHATFSHPRSWLVEYAGEILADSWWGVGEADWCVLLTLAGCQVPTKPLLSLPLLSRTGGENDRKGPGSR